MACILLFLLPLAWALTGWLVGKTLSLSIPTEGGQRLGATLGRWSALLLPTLYLLLLLLAVSGNAGHGLRLFGSEALFGLLTLPVYLVPGLGLYAGAACVVRDVVRGVRSWRG